MLWDKSAYFKRYFQKLPIMRLFIFFVYLFQIFIKDYGIKNWVEHLRPNIEPMQTLSRTTMQNNKEAIKHNTMIYVVDS